MMKNQKLLALILSASIAASLAGCSGGGISAAVPSAEPESGAGTEKIKMAVLIPGSPTDGGFCQQGADAAEALRAQGYDVALVEAVDAETIKGEAEDMANDGYKIIFGHGAQTVTPLAEISPDYPNTYFVTLGGEVVTENQFPICVCAEEGCYVLGVVAAKMTQTRTIGYTLGGDYPSYTKYTNALKLAAKTVDPAIDVKASILSATTPTEGYEATMSQIGMGADIIFSNSNEGQQGALKAVNESAGVYGLGCLGDFAGQYPDKVLASMVCNYSIGYLEAAKAILDGTIEPSIMFMTMSNGSVDFVWNERLRDTLPEEVVKAADQAKQDIIDGKIDVPNEYELESSAALS